MMGKYGALYGVTKSVDLMGAKMQSQIQKDSQQLQSAVSYGGDTYNVDVPVHIYPLQKLDETEIRKLTKDISKYTITEINNSLAKKGFNSVRNPLRP